MLSTYEETETSRPLDMLSSFMSFSSKGVVLLLCIMCTLISSFHRGLFRLGPKGKFGSARRLTGIRAATPLQAVKSIATSGTVVSLLENAVLRSVKNRFEQQLPLDKYGNKATLNPMVVHARPEHGDYQCMVAMSLAKQLKMKPKDVAESVMQDLQTDSTLGAAAVLGSMDISGPGFINMHLSQPYIEGKIKEMLRSPRLGVPVAEAPQRIVVDFSSPNIAKEMHVGHLRSTIIGDSLSRVLEFLGHDVLRLNHVGDWGTQFGMLIHFLKTHHPHALPALSASAGSVAGPSSTGAGGGEDEELGVEIGDLVEFYKAAKRCFDEDPAFKDAARAEVVRLQAGDAQNLLAWRAICRKSRAQFQLIYDLLRVKIEERGESFYNPLLPSLVRQLQESGAVVTSEGAQCVFLDGFNNTDGTPLPLIVQKSDGGFLYATTDLAAVAHRVATERAQRILYVTDAGQAQHFQMVFQAANKTGITSIKDNEGQVQQTAQLQHVPFGLVLGEDGKKIKSRAGDSVKLRELLDEAVRRAEQNEVSRAAEKSAEGGEAEDPQIVRDRARVLGLGAVKYADLSMSRESNYRFSFDKMLSLSGNTAPYMLYAYVRIRGIQRRAAAESAVDAVHGGGEGTAEKAPLLQLQEAEEVALAKHLIRLHEVLATVGADLHPHRLCDYIYELSQRFNRFYDACPVLHAPSPQARHSRTQLCALTADTLKLSLELLGMETVEKM